MTRTNETDRHVGITTDDRGPDTEAAGGAGRFAGAVATERDLESVFPLSAAQRGIWFAQQLNPEIPLTIAQYVDLRGELDVDLLEQAMIVTGKEIGSGYLRILDVDGVPHQMVDPEIDQSVVRIDFSGEPDPEAAAHRWMQEEYTAPLDLVEGPLILIAMLTVDIDRRFWYARCHHVALDGMGAINLLTRSAELYNAAVGGTPLPEPGAHNLRELYEADAKYANSSRREADRQYWRDLLRDAPEPTSFAPRQSPLQARSIVARTPMAGDAVARVGETGGQLAPMAIAAFAAYFAALTGNEDVVLSLPVSARTTAVMRRAGGMVSNVVPLRITASPETTVAELVRSAELQLLGALRHQRFRTEDIRRYAGAAADERGDFGPMVNIMMGLGDLRVGELTSRVNVLSVGPVSDLTLALYESGSGDSHVDFIANPGRYSATELERHHQRFADYFGRFVDAEPSTPIVDLAVVDPDEHAWLTSHHRGRDAGPVRLFADILAEAVARSPEAPAVVFGAGEWTYRELDEESNRLARALIAHGVGPESSVALAIPRSFESVLSVWATVKTGAAFVPIDPNHPAERIAYMLDDAGVRLGLSLSELRGELPDSVRWLVLDSSEAEDQYNGYSPAVIGADERLAAVRADNPAYMIYTSGSTGMPKGVVVSHRGLNDMTTAQRARFSVETYSRTMHFASPSFDASVFELLLAFAHSATLVVVPSSIIGGTGLSDFVRDNRIDVASVTPAALATVDPSGAEGLGSLVVAGDVCAAELVEQWAPGRQMLNFYGPTEATIWATASAPLEVGQRITIGRAIEGMGVAVLDRRLRPVPIDVSGELYLSGPALARGYHGKPGLTAGRFVANPSGDGTRMYRTGDVVRWTPEGELEYVGRSDFQVKVRGFRIELGEIAEALASHDSVDFAVAQVVTGAAGQKTIVGYVRPAPEAAVDAAALLAHAAASLPAYMVPSQIVTLDQIPLTANGKLDRAALPEPDVTGRRDYVAPRRPRETALVAVLEEVLALDRISMSDNIFALGADSLLVLTIRSRLRSSAGLDLSLPDVFASRTVADLAAAAVSATSAGDIPVPAPRPDVIPLSYPQTRLWILNRVDAASGGYNIPGAVRLPPELDSVALEAAVTDVLERHEPLRTTFPADEDGTPMQVVHSIDQFSVRGIYETADASAHDLESTLAGLAHAGFDLVADLPVRIRLVRVHAGGQIVGHALLVVMHHIVSDGASLAPLIRDLLTAYTARAHGVEPGWDPLPISYVDYSLWQRNELGDANEPSSLLGRQLEFWREELRGLPDVMGLPADHPRPSVMTGAGAHLDTWVDADTVAGLRRIAGERGITLFSVFQAVTAAALARFAGVDDTVLGTAVAGRGEAYLADLVGMFVNNVVLRQHVDQKQSVAELLATSHEIRSRALSNADAPFDQVVDALQVHRSRDHSPLFQFQIVMQHDHVLAALADRDDIELIDSRAPLAKFDMSLAIVEYGHTGPHADEMSIEFEYATELYDRQTVERFSAYLHRVLRRLAVQSDALELPVEELFDFAEVETRPVLVRSAGAHVRFPSVTVPDLVASRVQETPHATALVFGRRSVSYREFGARVTALARELIAAGAGPETAVGVCIDRSVEMVVAIHAVLAAGAQYVPIDTQAPSDRAAHMISAAGASTVLVAARTDIPRALVPLASVTVWEVDATGEIDPGTKALESGERRSPLRPDHAAYTLFTSGSTGQPKGVTVSHEAIVNRLLWGLDAFPWGPGDRVILKTPYTFDVSLPELFAPLIGGAAMIIAAPGGHADPQYLAGLIESSEATSVHFVPSMLSVFLDVIDRERLTKMTTLRWLFASGEALPPATVAAAHEVWPQAEIHNLFGPTEAAVEVGWADVSGAPAVVTIGRPVPNTTMMVLDGRLGPVPVGVPGELYLGGVQLARGYAGRADLTADRFIADPHGGPGDRLYRTGDLVRWNNAGDIEYLGRTDFQVKLRGQRIELGEIEAVLAAAPGVVHAAATVERVAGGAEHLIGYVSAGPGEHLDLAGVKTAVREVLPGYMVPTVWMVVDDFVLSTAGKIDRRALPAAVLPDVEYIAPRTDIEGIVADAFAEVLGVAEVSVTESFFDLGGNSLSATQAVARLGSALDRRIPVAAIFEASSVAELAEYIGNAARTRVHRAPLRARESGDRGPLSTGQRGMWLINRAHPESSVYNVVLALRLDGDLDRRALRSAVTDVLDRHESLRTYYPMVDGEPVAVVLPLADALTVVGYEYIDAGEDPTATVMEFTGRGFDVTVAPPVRMAVLETAPKQYILAAVLHHITADGVSTIPLAHDLMASYGARIVGRAPDLTPLPVQYLDFASWQQELLGTIGEDGRTEERRQLDYWQERLSGAPSELGLPLDRARPATPTFRGGEVEFEVPGDLVTALDEVARDTASTLFMVTQAAFAVLLSRLTASSDIVIGTPYGGRDDPALDSLVGMFVNTLALRTSVRDDEKFSDLLARVRSEDLGDMDNGVVPFDTVVSELLPRIPTAFNPIYQVIFAFQNFYFPAVELPGLTVTPVSDQEIPAKVDLQLTLYPTDPGLQLGVGTPAPMRATFVYAADILDQDTVEIYAKRYLRVLRDIADNPNLLVSDISIAIAEDTPRVVEAAEPVTSLSLLVADAAGTDPEAIAVSFDGSEVTFATLSAMTSAMSAAMPDQDSAMTAALIGLVPALATTPEQLGAVLDQLRCNSGQVLGMTTR